MPISRGDAVVIEGTRHEGEEGRVLGIDGGEAFLDILGTPGKTRSVPTKYLADSPWTENDDWSFDKEDEIVDWDNQYQPSVPLEQFDMDDRVEVTGSNNELYIGATGTVIDAEKINGEWSVMVFLDMPYDCNRDFAPTDLEKIS
jgi:hypothetical protein